MYSVLYEYILNVIIIIFVYSRKAQKSPLNEEKLYVVHPVELTDWLASTYNNVNNTRIQASGKVGDEGIQG